MGFQVRALAIALAIFCFGIYVAFLGASGYAGNVAPGGSGPDMQEDRDAVSGNVSGDINVSNTGGSGDSNFFGINVKSGNILATFGSLIANIPQILAWFFVPTTLAEGIKNVSTILLGIGVVQVTRGLIFE